MAGNFDFFTAGQFAKVRRNVNALYNAFLLNHHRLSVLWRCPHVKRYSRLDQSRLVTSSVTAPL